MKLISIEKLRREKQAWPVKSADVTAVFTNRLIYDDTVADRLPKDFILCAPGSSDPKLSRWELDKARKPQENEKKAVVTVTLEVTPKVVTLEAV